jgi:hypothetical protein
MEPSFHASLTPEQIAAIQAGGGFARCENPSTHVHYQLTQFEPPTLDEDYFREKLAEAALDIARGNVSDWDVEEIKAAGREKLAQKRAGN